MIRELSVCVAAVLLILIAGCSSTPDLPADVAQQFGKVVVPETKRIEPDIVTTPIDDLASVTPSSSKANEPAELATDSLFPPEAQVIGHNPAIEEEQTAPAVELGEPAPPAEPTVEAPKSKLSGMISLILAAAAAAVVAWMQRPPSKESQDGPKEEADDAQPPI